MENNILKMLVVGTLLILQFSGIAGASDSFLTCEDFEKDKREDCEFVIGEKLNEDDEQAILSALLEDGEESKWETPEYNEIGLRTLTNKRTYMVGDTIEVEIFPKNVFVSLTSFYPLFFNTSVWVKDLRSRPSVVSPGRQY